MSDAGHLFEAIRNAFNSEQPRFQPEHQNVASMLARPDGKDHLEPQCRPSCVFDVIQL